MLKVFLSLFITICFKYSEAVKAIAGNEVSLEYTDVFSVLEANSKNYICGAVLITSTKWLTVASSVCKKRPENLMLQSLAKREYGVKQIYCHPNFCWKSMINNFAVLQSFTPIHGVLCSSGFNSFGGSKITAVGFAQPDKSWNIHDNHSYYAKGVISNQCPEGIVDHPSLACAWGIATCWRDSGNIVSNQYSCMGTVSPYSDCTTDPPLTVINVVTDDTWTWISNPYKNCIAIDLKEHEDSTEDENYFHGTVSPHSDYTSDHSLTGINIVTDDPLDWISNLNTTNAGKDLEELEDSTEDENYFHGTVSPHWDYTSDPPLTVINVVTDDTLDWISNLNTTNVGKDLEEVEDSTEDMNHTTYSPLTVADIEADDTWYLSSKVRCDKCEKRSKESSEEWDYLDYWENKNET